MIITASLFSLVIRNRYHYILNNIIFILCMQTFLTAYNSKFVNEKNVIRDINSDL